MLVGSAKRVSSLDDFLSVYSKPDSISFFNELIDSTAKLLLMKISQIARV